VSDLLLTIFQKRTSSGLNFRKYFIKSYFDLFAKSFIQILQNYIDFSGYLIQASNLNLPCILAQDSYCIAI